MINRLSEDSNPDSPSDRLIYPFNYSVSELYILYRDLTIHAYSIQSSA